MNVVLACTWLVHIFLAAVCVADKYSYFDMAADQRRGSDIMSTLHTRSAVNCTRLCMDYPGCTACNWQQTTGACELVTNHNGPNPEQGFRAYTRKYSYPKYSKWQLPTHFDNYQLSTCFFSSPYST